jgi:glycosyltransferase involved in cell wall biosynthesis
LDDAPKIQSRVAELWRLAMRGVGFPHEKLTSQTNDWLMSTMVRNCTRPRVTAVHAYDDSALRPFREAKRLGKACIFDLPTGYYDARDKRLQESSYDRPAQKREEMSLADLVLSPSTFAAGTIRQHHPDKRVVLVPYGVDGIFWNRSSPNQPAGKLRFLFAGLISLQKGIPLLLDAWRKADLKDAELILAGSWQLSGDDKRSLPNSVSHAGALDPEDLRDQYRRSNVLAFPSLFEGFGMVVLEAMACGLPVIASSATCGPDVLTEDSGRLVPAGDLEALVESLRWFSTHRDRVDEMGCAARLRAEQFTWDRYRTGLLAATAPFV